MSDLIRYQAGNGSMLDHWRKPTERETLCKLKGTTGRDWKPGDPKGRMCNKCDRKAAKLKEGAT